MINWKLLYEAAKENSLFCGSIYVFAFVINLTSAIAYNLWINTGATLLMAYILFNWIKKVYQDYKASL